MHNLIHYIYILLPSLLVLNVIFPGGGEGAGGGGGGGGGGTQPPKPAGSLGNNPGLITSTGGLTGIAEALLTPAFNLNTGVPFLILHDSSNFNCEDPAEYDYRQEANYDKFPGEGRVASIHRIVLKYREIDKAKFNLNITVFIKEEDDFVTYTIPVTIPAIPLKTNSRKQNFPDNKIHTQILRPPKGVITGERPQVTLTSVGNKGAYAITKVVLCGNADEISEM